MPDNTNPFQVPDLSLPQYLFQDKEKVADRPALIDAVSGTVLNYRDLQSHINTLAAGLLETGVARGDVIAMVCGNSIDFVVLYLAAASIGAVISPMSSQFLAGEIRAQILGSNAVFLFADERSLPKAVEAAVNTGIRKIFSTVPAENILTLQQLSSTAPFLPASLDPRSDLAAVPFSSGTTGLPKGVILTHHNLVANTAQLVAVEPVSPQDTFIGLLPFSHIYGLTVVLHLGLRSGAAIVIMPSFDKELLLKSIQKYRVTRAHFVPPILRILAQSGDLSEYDLSSLEIIVSGAAPLDENTAQGCARKLNCVVKQGYGLTESSPVTHIAPDPPEDVRPASVGLALPGTSCRIVDPVSRQDLPVGSHGEVLVHGPQVMSGYLNEPEATRAAISPDGWLRTGDIGYLDDDGYLYIVDRIKEMIKVKGYQVAPAEIEAVLVLHPDILDAAVISSPDAEAGEVPHGFIVTASNLSTDEVIAHTAAHLSPIKRLRKVTFVEKIPRSASGKILRRVLIDAEKGKTE